MDTLKECEQKQLRNKYGRKLEQCVERMIFSGVPLKRKVPYEFYHINKNLVGPILWEKIADNKKGKYLIKEKKIAIADWTIEQRKDIMYHVILHEMLHATFPDDSEEDIRKKTECYMKIITSNLYWKLTY